MEMGEMTDEWDGRGAWSSSTSRWHAIAANFYHSQLHAVGFVLSSPNALQAFEMNVRIHYSRSGCVPPCNAVRLERRSWE